MLTLSDEVTMDSFTKALVAATALLTLTVFTSAPAVAQTTLGVRGGVSVSSASLDIGETFDDSNRTGFVGGVFLDFAGSGLIGFQVGAQYSQKGAELDLDGAVEDLSLDYLEIPAVVKVGLPLGTLKPSVFGGVALGFNSSCDEFVVDGSDICDEFSDTEFSGVVGADLAIYLGGISVWGDARYNFGLNDVSGDLDFIDDLKNRAWNLTAGIGFPLGG